MPARQPPPLHQRAFGHSTGFDLDSTLDSGFADSLITEGQPGLPRWMGWRLRMLVVAALLGCLAMFALAQWLAMPARPAAQWQPGARGQVQLARSPDPALQALRGMTLAGVAAPVGSVMLSDALTLQPSARWIVDDQERRRYIAVQQALNLVLTQPHVTLLFANGRSLGVATQPRTLFGLGGMFWLLCMMALALYMVATVVVLARPTLKNLLYAAMALCQTGNLAFIAAGTTLNLALPAPLASLDLPARLSFDLLTAAAVVHAACLHPRRLPGSQWIPHLVWSAAIVLVVMATTGNLDHAWWWAQGSVIALGLLATLLLRRSYRIEPHPFAVVLRRLAFIVVGTWMLLTLGVWAADGLPGAEYRVAAVGMAVWYMFFAALLLLIPFLAQSQRVLREFLLLAGISTIATSLDLLFIAWLSLGQFASLTLSLFLALGVYSGARQWILNQLLGSSMVTTERMFEQLYRIAREVEHHPERVGTLLSHLLRDLFEPMDLSLLDKRVSRAHMVGDGSALIVPVPRLPVAGSAEADGSIVLRFAQRGRRLFTSDDARLANRIVEQLRRAIAFDQAVEQGRSEERLRLAQDLHDDIGARLLTLMYQAPSAEIEDYLRHTLQDLKTLTRGLAAPGHRLSHALGEWKADISRRLQIAGIQLDWSASHDEDPLLTVVQWSALTRVLRELVSNTISHSHARRVQISFRLENGRLELCVTDDGEGRDPAAWAEGLGLSGVRKRIRQLGGQVDWREVTPAGICCRVSVRRFGS